MRMTVKNDPVYVRRRLVALASLVLLVALVTTGMSALFGGPAKAPKTTATVAAQPTATGPVPSPTVSQGEPGPSAQTELVQVHRLTGDLQSKSVVASNRGHVYAQNMMYKHSVTVYGANAAHHATISDSVDLAKFGITGHPGVSKGAPVEMAFNSDGSRAWVSNYAMYGQGFSKEGPDSCTSDKGLSPSYVYEIDTRTSQIVRVIPVGVTPKYVAVTPDDKQVLVTNWCSFSMTVIEAKSGEVTATVPLGGQHPRGIAVSPNSRTAYVALMGADTVVQVDLRSGKVRPFANTGKRPRHIVINKDGSRLYISNNDDDTVSELDDRGRVLRTVKTQDQPRSMAISPDGGALYVVNYGSGTLSKIRTSDLKVVQTVRTDGAPIGVTYEPTRKHVWVACYGGTILVFDDSRKAAG
ncbi:beta-propeller fold lactonase family protein [Actinomycetota bacterium]